MDTASNGVLLETLVYLSNRGDDVMMEVNGAFLLSSVEVTIIGIKSVKYKKLLKKHAQLS